MGFGNKPDQKLSNRGKQWKIRESSIVPLILAIGGFWLNRIQKDRDKKAEEAQKQREEDAAIEREKLERESREDNQRETALQAYIDKVSELLLHEGLRESDPEKEARKIARVRTLTVLPRLDADRKRSVLQFLYESGLIDKGKRIVDLRDADLNGANLLVVNLSGADLSGAFLTADLAFANLSGAGLHQAHLLGAHLSNVNLCGADLKEANLSDANLSGANLKDAKNITTEELEKQAKSLKGATMPDGSIHS